MVPLQTRTTLITCMHAATILTIPNMKSILNYVNGNLNENIQTRQSTDGSLLDEAALPLL